MDPNDPEIKKQREKFIKAFDQLAESTANIAAISKKQIDLINKQIEVTNGVIEALMMPKDGMRDVMDELIDEIRGLREDIRIVAKAGGLQGVLALFGNARRRNG